MARAKAQTARVSLVTADIETGAGGSTAGSGTQLTPTLELTRHVAALAA